MTVERLGAQGDGIAPGPVYVRRALPGEVVEGTLDGDRLVDARIVQPAADRVSPPCSHFKSCGGCSVQHMGDDAVAQWKIAVVADALARAGVEAPINRHVETSPPGSRRRATLSGRRTKSGALVGFHAHRSDQIIGIEKCQTVHPDILAALPLFHDLVVLGGSRKSELRMAVTATESGLDLSVGGGKPLDLDLRQKLVGRSGDLAKLTWNEETVATFRTPVITLGPTQVPLPSGAFLQASLHGQIALQAAVERALEDTDGPVVDLFAGCGTFALPVATRRPVHAVEADQSMLGALDHGWRHGTGLRHISTECRDLFRRPLDAAELAAFSAAIIDPPRAGALAQTKELANSALTCIAAVSCNPVSFARDARILCDAGFRIDWITVVDQFRWSPHVELVARISR